MMVSLHAEETCTSNEGNCKLNLIEADKLRDFTISQLREFTGSSHKLPLYVALLGFVYDVSSSADLYGEGKPFHCYAGRDASLAIAKDSCDSELFLDKPLEESHVDHLSADVQIALKEWIRLFQVEFKYPIVGRVSAPGLNRHFTLAELAQHTGKIEHLSPHRIHPEVLICLNHKVYDVSYGGNSMYGEGQGYHMFAGKDASRALAMMSFEPQHFQNNDLSLLSDKDREGLVNWEKTFHSKYPIVGSCEKFSG